MTRALLIASLLLAACGAPQSANRPGGGAQNGPSKRVFGTIAYYAQPVTITLSRMATVGEPVTVSVTTSGDGCIVRGETDVRQEGLRVEIRPYDYNTSPGGVCDDMLRLHVHSQSVTFAAKGSAEIVVYGLEKNASGASNVMETRTLNVR